jgi:hypothetical protein
MFQPVTFPAECEPLVRLLEDTPTEHAVTEAVRLLREGVSETALATAAALAVSRSSELPFVHHGGPLHPVAALPAVRGTMDRLPLEERWLPLIQDVALVSRHIHDSGGAPYLMPAMEPRGAGDVPQTVGAFRNALRRNTPAAAEHAFLWLLQQAPRTTALEALLRVAVANYRYDEHKLILAVNTIRLLDWIGWEHAPTLLRVAVRYNFMPSIWAERGSRESLQLQADRIEALAQPFDVPASRRPLDAAGEQAALAELREVCAGAALDEIPRAIAEALARGVSLTGAAEAVSVAACDLFLQADTDNAMGIHFMTGANAIRWVCRHFPSLGSRALLAWTLGPETRGIKQSRRAELPTRVRGHLPELRALLDNREPQTAAALALRLTREEAPAAVLCLSAMAAARDDTSEMHAMKHCQAMAEEWSATRPEWAPVHLAAQAKECALYAHLPHEVHEQAQAALGQLLP